MRQSSASAAEYPVSLSTAPANSVNAEAREFLSFKLGNEEYGMDILCVQEIRSFEKPTRLANAPAHVLGVVNLRGVIVPIVDMRIKLNLAPATFDTFTVVIILSFGAQLVGWVVDGVSDVISLTTEQMRPAPDFSTTVGSDHVLAIGSVPNRMLILLDIDKLMNSADMGLILKSAQ